MKILLTGATGFIGSQLAQALLARGHDVVAAVRSPERWSAQPWHRSVRLLPLDVAAPPADLFEDAGRPDALLHAAWDRLDDYRDTVHFERLLPEHYRFISQLVRAGLRQCLVLGTCLEYGMQEGALREDQPCRPQLAYPLAKHLLHQMLEGLQQVTPFTLQWARLFYTWGPGQRRSSLLAQLDTAIEAGAAVFDMSPGDQLRDYLPVEKLALLLARIAECRDFDGTINCCSGKPTSVRELVETRIRARAATIAPNAGRFAYPKHEPFAFWGDTTRLRQLLGELP